MSQERPASHSCGQEIHDQNGASILHRRRGLCRNTSEHALSDVEQAREQNGITRAVLLPNLGRLTFLALQSIEIR